MTKKQTQISKRQKLLSQIIPNAISCDYISEIDRVLPDGREIKTITINQQGYAYSMLAYKNGEPQRLKTNKYQEIEGIKVYYISL